MQPALPGQSTAVFVPSDARAELAITVAALRRGDSYPAPVGRVDTIETHMSWVFLTVDRAYKLKKPQRTRWFDHTSRQARRRACDHELNLNRRLSPEVYLGVVPVTAAGGRLRVGAPGTPVDWLLEMHRLPAALMLEAQLARGAVDRSRIRRAAALLASFYLSSEPAGWSGEQYLDHLVADVEAKAASVAQARYQLDRDLVATVAAALRAEMVELAGILEQRAVLVGDLHGDLRPEHIQLGEQPAFIDCLDFDRELRLLDPASELAFLALECRRLGDPRIGGWFLDTYAAIAGDHLPPALVRLYQGYHALVRAAVAVWHLDDQSLDPPQDRRLEAQRYLELGRDILQAG